MFNRLAKDHQGNKINQDPSKIMYVVTLSINISKSKLYLIRPGTEAVDSDFTRFRETCRGRMEK